MTDPSPDDRAPARPSRAPREVEYKGAPLDAERGPGLGCFWSQLVVLLVLIVLTPLSVSWGWPVGVSAALLVAVLVLLLISGQTVIFLLRLVAADRARGRRRPLASTTPTVGELEDAEGDREEVPETRSTDGDGHAEDAPDAPRRRDVEPGMRE